MTPFAKSSLGVFALSFCLLSPGGAAAKDLVIAADPWCPFNCEPGSDKPGYLVEIAKEVFEPLGHTVTYETVNWARALVTTREGQYDAVFGAARGDAEDFVFPSEPLGQAGNAYFVRQNDPWKLDKPEALSGKTVGLIRDYDYGGLEADIEKYATAEYVGGNDPLPSNIKKLLAERLDVVVEEASVFNYTAGEMGVLDKVRLESSGDYDPIYIAFSPAKDDSKQLAADLDAGMAKLRESGRLKEILAKYGLTDWK